MMKLKSIKKYIIKKSYIKYYKNTNVNNYFIFLESQHGQNINGNIFYILKELSSNSLYKDYILFLGVAEGKKNIIQKLLHNYCIDNVHILIIGSKDYYIKLSESKYLFNDTSFLTFFIKKKEQIYINTWHGTPLKTLGKYVKNDYYRIGNVQKNFVESDYILAPNSFFKNKIVDSFMLESIFDGAFLMEGYPRNSIFFNDKRRELIRKELNLENKQIFAYMPTWRGIVGKINNEIDTYKEQLKYLDSHMQNNQCLFVNFHPFISSNISYNSFQHILPFPFQYETYDFLNVVDCLITDYSSVFFDFVNTRKKIILFNYDEEEYTKERGLYLSLEQLPFPKVNNTKDLLIEMNKGINYDIIDFLNEYCLYENNNVSEDICKHVILNKKCIKEEKLVKNGKKNVLIFAGRMVNNGITTSLLNLMNCIDTNRYNIYISFANSDVDIAKDNLLRLPSNVNYYPHFGKSNFTILESIYILRYYMKLVHKNKSIQKMSNMYKYEINRIFGHASFDEVIHFSGYGFKTIWLYSQFPCHRSIYVHNDMIQEINQRHNQNIYALKFAYNSYDNVVIVTEDIKDSTKRISQSSSNIVLCKNLIDYKNIELKGNQNLQIEDRTEMSCTLKEFEEKLLSSNFKFINVGRYSVEKGHFRLIDAFDRFYQKYKDVLLIIIGGDGALYRKTLQYAQKKSSRDNIIFIKNIMNPLPIVKKCDGFILSSLYEGFGLVLVEANILGVPIVSTDIVGPRGFMNKYLGRLVPDNGEGIYEGMEELYNNKVEVIEVDYEKYNHEAIQQFYSLLDDDNE